MSLDFLKHVGINEEELNKKTPRAGGGHRKEWTPIHPNTLRIWKDGSVFPSVDLVDRFGLEYQDKPAPLKDTPTPEQADAVAAEGAKADRWLQPGNAFDILDSNDFPVFKTPRRLILANVVAKSQGKADVFASGDWDAETGKVNASVLTQGANTFGKRDLIPMLKAVYDVTLDDNRPYVDLVFVGKHGAELKPDSFFSLPEGKKVAFIPKKVSRGDKAGTPTVVRREDPWLYILLPLEEVDPEAAKKAKSGAKLVVEAGAEPATQN